jgi:hypothetical protein
LRSRFQIYWIEIHPLFSFRSKPRFAWYGRYEVKNTSDASSDDRINYYISATPLTAMMSHQTFHLIFVLTAHFDDECIEDAPILAFTIEY